MEILIGVMIIASVVILLGGILAYDDNHLWTSSVMFTIAIFIILLAGNLMNYSQNQNKIKEFLIKKELAQYDKVNGKFELLDKSYSEIVDVE